MVITSGGPHDVMLSFEEQSHFGRLYGWLKREGNWVQWESKLGPK